MAILYREKRNESTSALSCCIGKRCSKCFRHEVRGLSTLYEWNGGFNKVNMMYEWQQIDMWRESNSMRRYCNDEM